MNVNTSQCTGSVYYCNKVKQYCSKYHFTYFYKKQADLFYNLYFTVKVDFYEILLFCSYLTNRTKEIFFSNALFKF